MTDIIFQDITIADIDLSYELHRQYCKFLQSLGVEINMTQFSNHEQFVLKFINDNDNHPYKKWYMICFGDVKIGYVVIKKIGEFGYVLLEEYRDVGIGTKFFTEFFKLHKPETVWARSKIENKRSHHMLEKFGFNKTDYEFHYEVR